MKYEPGKTYDALNVGHDVQVNIIRKLDQLGNDAKLESVKIIYNGMQLVAGRPIAMVWTFACDVVIPTSFWVMV